MLLMKLNLIACCTAIPSVMIQSCYLTSRTPQSRTSRSLRETLLVLQTPESAEFEEQTEIT